MSAPYENRKQPKPMFSTQCIKSFPVAIATGMLGAIFAASPAKAEGPAVGTASVMNQNNSVYAETLKLYLYPARLEVIEAPRPTMDDPAVIVAKGKQVPHDSIAKFSLHPAVAVSKTQAGAARLHSEVYPFRGGRVKEREAPRVTSRGAP